MLWLTGDHGRIARSSSSWLTSDVLREDEVVPSAVQSLHQIQQEIAEATTEPWPAMSGPDYRAFPEPDGTLGGGGQRVRRMGRRRHVNLRAQPGAERHLPGRARSRDRHQARHASERRVLRRVPSQRDASPRSVQGFRTDPPGRYCIVWADERGLPYVESVGEVRTPWQPLSGRRPPPGCRSGEEGIPWNRADNIIDSPQFLAVPAILVPGMILLLIPLVRGDVSEAGRPRAAGLALAVAGTVLAALLWLT